MSISKYTCGALVPSGCVIFTGEVPSFIDLENTSCELTLDEVLEHHSDQIENILDQIDLTELNPGCLDFDPDTVTVSELHQIEVDKLCDLETRLAIVETQLENLNIADEIIEIDLGCLAPAAAPCEQGTDMYTLISILTLFKNEICNIKAQL